MGKILLQFFGTVDLNQFWPNFIDQNGKKVAGQSDADTVKVVIEKTKGFLIQRTPKGTFQKTDAFNNVLIKGKGIKKPPIDDKGRIVIRLQGIDAPELHFKPPIKGAKDLGQFFGQTATVKLHDYLKNTYKSDTLNCVVKTYVEKPEDVFDCYGRFIGDVIILKDKKESKNINHWLVENGWAFPTYYVSMTTQEIKTIESKVAIAISNKLKLGIWSFPYPKNIGKVATSTTQYHYGKNASYIPKDDMKSPVIMPKIFRRQYTYEAKKAGKTFVDFLKTQKDLLCDTKIFLSNKPYKNYLVDFYTKFNSKGDILFKPSDVVFDEASSSLIDAKTLKPVTKKF
jgi:endonuclease YncB( thermonuclease family)